MARYRKVDVRVWNDGKFRKLSPPRPNGQTLWLWLLTSPSTTNVPGLFASGEAGMAEALGWELAGFRKAFSEIAGQGMVRVSWADRLVWIPNALRYNPPESPNVVRNWRAAWDELPECPLKVEAFLGLKAFVEGLGEGFRKAFLEAFGEGYVPVTDDALADPSGNQEQEQEQEQEKEISAEPDEHAADVEEVIAYYLEAMRANGKKPRPTDKRKKLIRARLKEGIPIAELKQAIDGLTWSDWHMGRDPKTNGAAYTDIKYCMKDADAVEAMAERVPQNRRGTG